MLIYKKVLISSKRNILLRFCVYDGGAQAEGCKVNVPVLSVQHKLSDSQVCCCTLVKETLAIFFSFHKLHLYLCNDQFTIRTDHTLLLHLKFSTNRKI